jgi:hypothetical protein
MTERNIKGGFRGAGLVPLNPESVVSKLDVQLRTSTPVEEEASASTSWVSKTPKTVHEVESQSEYPKDELDGLRVAPRVNYRSIKVFCKGSN